jgi:asparagine synthase (glutamine-hydrolysing)
MCGITGGWFLEEKDGLEVRMKAALYAMRLRGPNDSGHDFIPSGRGAVVLGHTRLSVIDLSAGGHQPMHSVCGRYTMVFNGEIYNYLELKSELMDLGVTFRSASDSEVLLAAWAQWGKSCLKRLVGMFAFAICDRKENSLTCVRDGFGIKPLLFSYGDDGFVFASEIGAIKALKKQKLGLDWQSAYDYLVHGDYDNGHRSFVSGVSHLLPGHLVSLNTATGEMDNQVRWWRPEITQHDIGFQEATEILREKFLNSIRLHLRSDVAIGAALSGGLDSSAVVCAMRHVAPHLPIKTFSFIARGSTLSEENWVDQINTFVGAEAHKIVVQPEDMARDIDDMIRAQGEPFGNTSIYAQYRVFKAARAKGVTVTLDGQGADEMLAGYSGYPGQRLHSLLDEKDWRGAVSFLNNWAKWPGRSRIAGCKRLAGELTSGDLYRQLRRLNGHRSNPPWLNAGPMVANGVQIGFDAQHEPHEQPGRRVVAALRNALTQKGLPSLLRHADRNSMRFSVESRVPFLTLDLAEFLLALPEEYLISSMGETKHIFRAAMRGIVLDSILDRRDKIGFATPEKEWLMPIAKHMRGWLQQDPGLPFLNQTKILAEFDAVMDGRRPFTSQIWRWVNFYRWHHQVIAQ